MLKLNLKSKIYRHVSNLEYRCAYFLHKYMHVQIHYCHEMGRLCYKPNLMCLTEFGTCKHIH